MASRIEDLIFTSATHHKAWIIAELFAREFLRVNNLEIAWQEVCNLLEMDYTVWGAQRIFKSELFQKRLAELRAELQNHSLLTLQDHLQQLADLRDKAADAGKYGPAIMAEVYRGKAMGFYETKPPDGSVPAAQLPNGELTKLVERVAQQNPQLLERLIEVDNERPQPFESRPGVIEGIYTKEESQRESG